MQGGYNVLIPCTSKSSLCIVAEVIMNHSRFLVFRSIACFVRLPVAP